MSRYTPLAITPAPGWTLKLLYTNGGTAHVPMAGWVLVEYSSPDGRPGDRAILPGWVCVNSVVVTIVDDETDVIEIMSVNPPPA